MSQPTYDERSIELAELIGALAHEIRNPLSTLKVNLQLLAEDFQDESVPESDLRRRAVMRLQSLHEEADRLGHILDGFMKFTAPHGLERVPADLNKVVQDLADFFGPQADSAGIRLRVSLAPGELAARLDVALIKQALLNLMLNAQHAMADGGELIVRTRRTPDRQHAQVEVTDTGPGIPAERLERIFKAFYSTKKQGVGLGLAITRRIVREHEGTIDVHSEPGRGSSFTITLPTVERQGAGAA